MPSDCISYQDSGYFSSLIVDYLNQKPELKSWYNRFPSIDNFKDQINEKGKNFRSENRQVLVESLTRQYAGFDVSSATRTNIELLSKNTTFTVTTGHQLNLFTGPLYFLYKIISAVNLAKELKENYPQNDFVPVYWMATEDHDFEEISYFNFKGKKFRWNRESSGAVGRLSTEGLNSLLELFKQDLGPSENAKKITDLFQKAYIAHQNLTEATRWLANELFGQYGLVIIDGDDRDLKRLFAPYVKQELTERVSYQKVSETITDFGYNVQVNPREINLFYLDDKLRERIVFENGKYVVNETSIAFSTEEILSEVDKNPQKFSPNVIMRPLYQEVILPNLCYIGGGGEIAYWLELKAFFDAVDVTFPVLLVRNSVLLSSEKQAKKADNLGLSWKDLFTKQAELVNRKVAEFSEFPLNLLPQKLALQKQFADLFALSEQTDRSFSGAVKAQEAKQTKGLENLEKRLLKAQKRKHADELERLTNLQNELFPFQGLQERQANFSEFYIEAGENLVPTLLRTLKPLEQRFDIIVI
ncbi:bacillithiol biosynthesis cysteine-adding enzyme BshC [Flavobacterium sp. MAH-1]|uniref:Putative cysteine ligase BshC n=1 Tax=Flavobacterium agri TaxID=2743471 RepID=A0A7Y8Y1Z6_9FLAO|nr:bacillithiol biosynthesis cysteine-adding enzyme BshC [Flavobacterium agri]NUY81120.1 bacillithiol biosynthesis cysteine-adding enzyme BshC [Flavobacterium agri]NYA71144.1 bacillithiol biosynthesis cysteine-adding enzyme BshC [Flavobacterium agri]